MPSSQKGIFLEGQFWVDVFVELSLQRTSRSRARGGFGPHLVLAALVVAVKLTGKAATSSLFLIECRREFFYSELRRKESLREREGNSQVVQWRQRIWLYPAFNRRRRFRPLLRHPGKWLPYAERGRNR